MGRTKALRIVDKKMVRAKKKHEHKGGTKAALLIQRCYRGHCVRREVGEILGVVRKIQAHFRGSRVRRTLAEASAAAEAVQKVLRGHQSRRLAEELRADRRLRQADARRRAQRDDERARQQPPAPPSDDEDDAELGLSKADLSRRGAAQSMLFQTAQEGSTEGDVENIEGALQILGANVRNRARATALHVASDAGFTPAVACLLGHGANTNVHDKVGRTPLLLACRHGHRQVAAELLRAGAHPNAPGSKKSPMAVAIDRDDAPTAEMLAVAGGYVPATHAVRGLLLGMRAKARGGEAEGGGATCQELIRASLELEGGDGYLTRLWEVVDSSAPNFCSRWPERKLVEWLRPRLKLEFSGVIGSLTHEAMVRRARVVGASMLEREARQEAKRRTAAGATASGSMAASDASLSSSYAAATPGSPAASVEAGSSSVASTPRTVTSDEATSHGSASPSGHPASSVASSASSPSGSDGSSAASSTHAESPNVAAAAMSVPAQPTAASQARMAQFKKARTFLQGQEKRRARIKNAGRIEQTKQRMKSVARAQAIENASKRELEREIAEREAAAKLRAEAAAAFAKKQLPRLLRMALKAGLTTEEEVEMLKQNVADGYTSVEHSVEMWEDQLEKVGILKDARLKRERHLASEAARRLIGKRVDISSDAVALEETIRDLVTRGFIPFYDVDYNQCAGTRGQVFQRSGELAVVQLDVSNTALAFPCGVLSVVEDDDDGGGGAAAKEGQTKAAVEGRASGGAIEQVRPRRQKPLGKLIGDTGTVQDTYRLTPTAELERPKTPGEMAFNPDGWEQNFIGMRQKELAEDSEFALLVLRQTAEEERIAYERSVEHKKKIGPRQLAAEGIATRKAVAVTEDGEKRLVFTVQEAKETRDEMLARVRKENVEAKRQRKLAEQRETELWLWGGERPTSKEEKRTVKTEQKSLKQKLKDKKAKQAQHTGVSGGGPKKKWNDQPPAGVYRVLCGCSLHDTADLISEIVGELPAGILVEATVIEPEPGIARLIDAGNAMVGSRQHWRAFIAGLDFNGWCTIATPKSENLVRVLALSKEEALEIDSLEDDLVGLHQRRLALQPVLKKRAQVASHRAQALNAVADRLEELDGQLEETWQPWRKKKLEREAMHLERKAKIIAEVQRVRDPKDSRRLEEIEYIMEDKQDRLRLLRMVEAQMEEERAKAAARAAEEAAARAEEERQEKERAEEEAAEAAKRLPIIGGGGGGGGGGPGNHMMLRRRGGAPPAGGISAAGMLPSLVSPPSMPGPDLSGGGGSPVPAGALRDRRRAGISPLMIAMPSPSAGAASSPSPAPGAGAAGGGGAAGGFSLMGMGAAAGAARVLRRTKGGGVVDENAKAEAAMHARLETAIRVARSYGPDRFDEVLAKELMKEGEKQTQMQQEVEQKAMLERLKRFGKPNHALATEGLPEDIEQWDTTQVIKWAKALGLGKRAYVLAARDVDGYALMWMAPESIVNMLCEDSSENKKKSTLAALETLRKENQLAKAETAAAREGQRFERLLERAQTFGVVDETAAQKIGDSVRNGEESRSHYVSLLSKKLQKYKYELS